MKKERSCGAVVYTLVKGKVRYLLVQNLNGIYGFPKGHVEGNETDIETALREVKEETGLDITILDGFQTSDSYTIPSKGRTVKDIIYFLGYYEDQSPVYQKEEILNARLCSYDEAISLFQFESSRRVLREANHFLSSRLSQDKE